MSETPKKKLEETIERYAKMLEATRKQAKKSGEKTE